ncbi:MAG: AAA family ATPase [Ramlibacter sp.]|nr:AAA family ATPase [Ramlibacter sp.]
MTEKFVLGRLPTNVPGLDELLGGGLVEYSFNLIAGSPGSGKTTLAHQIMFALANPQRRAIFFTVLGEPPMKMLRYQQQYSFFDLDKLDGSIRFVNLSEEVKHGNLERVLARIVEDVERFEPGLVFVDSFRSVVLTAEATGQGVPLLQQFVQRLGMHLTSWQATTFLIGEYITIDAEANPVFTVADGILWLQQSLHRNSMVRKIQISKSRGQATRAGLHTFRITNEGIEVFPRTLPASSRQPGPAGVGAPRAAVRRLSMGIAALDEMMGGGLPQGYSLLVSGPSGSGKSQLATQFLAEGERVGEKGIVAAFERSPGTSRNPRLDALVDAGDVAVVDTRALDLSIDETLHAITELIRTTGASRVVIDSLSGFELALAPTFREDFRESLHRLVAVLTGLGASVVMVSELEDRYTDLRFSPYGAAFLTDAIIVQRYVELHGDLRRVMAVVKVRNSAHSRSLRLFDITEAGICIGEPTPDMQALLSGHPRPAATPGPAAA